MFVDCIEIENLKVIVDDDCYEPERAHDADAGWDLKTPYDIVVPKAKVVVDNETGDPVVECGSVSVDTGVHFEIPFGFVGMIKSKSGLNVKSGVTSVGVVDSGYTGSVVAKLYNYTSKDVALERGSKITQIVFMPIAQVRNIKIVDSFEKTERGDDGFGSTGK